MVPSNLSGFEGATTTSRPALPAVAQQVVSLPSLQSRAETNVDAAAHLSVAANQAATIARARSAPAAPSPFRSS
jgi:hypothetical protein